MIQCSLSKEVLNWILKVKIFKKLDLFKPQEWNLVVRDMLIEFKFHLKSYFIRNFYMIFLWPYFLINLGCTFVWQTCNLAHNLHWQVFFNNLLYPQKSLNYDKLTFATKQFFFTNCTRRKRRQNNKTRPGDLIVPDPVEQFFLLILDHI